MSKISSPWQGWPFARASEAQRTSSQALRAYHSCAGAGRTAKLNFEACCCKCCSACSHLGPCSLTWHLRNQHDYSDHRSHWTWAFGTQWLL